MLQPGRGRDARRRSSPPRARYDPIQHPVAARNAARPRAAAHVRAGLPDALALRRGEGAGRCRRARTSRSPQEDTEVPVLHLLDQAAGRRPARRRPGGRAARVRGRPAGQDDDRLQAAGRRAERDRPVAAARVPAARAPRWWRSPTRTAWSGRWSAATTTASRRSTSPPRASASPGSSFKPFVLAEALRQRHLAAARPASSKKLTYTLKGGEKFTVNNYDDAYAGVRTLAQRDDLLRQLGLRAGRQAGRHQEDRGAGPPDGHPHAGLDQPRDGARRPRAGRDAAGHGPRVRDLRHRRQARSTARSRPGRATKRLPVPGPVGIERIDQRQEGQVRTRSSSTTAPSSSTSVKSKRVLKPEIASTVGSILQTVIKEGSGDARADPGRDDRRQDRHDRELRRRLVRRPGRRSTRSRSGSATRTSSSRWRPSSRAARSPAAPSRRRSGRPSCSAAEDRSAAQERRRRRHRRPRRRRPAPAPACGGVATVRADGRAAAPRAGRAAPAPTTAPPAEAPPTTNAAATDRPAARRTIRRAAAARGAPSPAATTEGTGGATTGDGTTG